MQNFIVNAGGDLCLRGQHWRRPMAYRCNNGVLASLDLRGSACVFTSGDYQRFFEFEGKRYYHIFDPRTGSLAQHTRSVSVTANDPALSDAAATALFVAGPGDWKKIAMALGVEHVLLPDRSDTAYLTPYLAEKLSYVRRPNTVKVAPLN